MADRLPSLTSAPSFLDLPLSTLTSALTSLFLPHPPATYLGSAPVRHVTGNRARAAAPGRMRCGEACLCGCERQRLGSREWLPSGQLRGRRARFGRRQREAGPEPDSGAFWAGSGPGREAESAGDCNRARSAGPSWWRSESWPVGTPMPQRRLPGMSEQRWPVLHWSLPRPSKPHGRLEHRPKE
ncbi:uncharacterized protein RBU33_007811 [Hipposideros larvatus]